MGFGEAQLHEFLEGAGFRETEISLVTRDEVNPQFQTILATGTSKLPAGSELMHQRMMKTKRTGPLRRSRSRRPERGRSLPPLRA